MATAEQKTGVGKKKARQLTKPELKVKKNKKVGKWILDKLRDSNCTKRDLLNRAETSPAECFKSDTADENDDAREKRLEGLLTRNLDKLREEGRVELEGQKYKICAGKEAEKPASDKAPSSKKRKIAPSANSQTLVSASPAPTPLAPSTGTLLPPPPVPPPPPPHLAKQILKYGDWDGFSAALDIRSKKLTFFPQEKSIKDPQREALIIANADYGNNDELPGALGDLRAVTGCLRELCFEITVAINQDHSTLTTVLQQFLQTSSSDPPKLKLLFYAGHGSSSGNELETSFHTIDNEKVRFLPPPIRGPTTCVCIIDSCRTEGRAGNMSWVAPQLNQKGYLVEFATSKGFLAETADNGRFTSFLVKHLKDDLPLPLMFQRVRTAMHQAMQASGAVQIPQEVSTLIGPDIYLGKFEPVNHGHEPETVEKMEVKVPKMPYVKDGYVIDESELAYRKRRPLTEEERRKHDEQLRDELQALQVAMRKRLPAIGGVEIPQK